MIDELSAYGINKYVESHIHPGKISKVLGDWFKHFWMYDG